MFQYSILKFNHFKGIIASLFLIILLTLSGCSTDKIEADEVYFNGTIYSVDSSFTVISAFAVKDGKIIATGTDDEILSMDYKISVDLGGKAVIPGFHDGHCHFYGYGNDLRKIWLTETSSFDDVLTLLTDNKNQLIGGWIFGRGWDQNKWNVKEYPNNRIIDSLFPDTPVFLLRVDGHASLANSVALKLAGITADTEIQGGIIEKKDGRLTGILLDKAVDLVYEKIPDYSTSEKIDALLAAQVHCFEKGITHVTDAGIENTGLKMEILNLIDSLHNSGQLKMKINAMAALEELKYFQNRGKIKTERLSVHGFKLYADGALGSRGACLIEDYKDQPGHAGFLIYPPSHLDSMAAIVAAMDFQLNTHCIGDSSHRLMLNIYAKYASTKSDHRWRIEHAQVIHPDDLSKYGTNKIIPSVQPVHATSDMYWAEDRLGKDRIRGAYAYNDLLKQNNMIISGSDFPVENINPMHGFFAAVVRKDQKGKPDGGFQIENKLSREDALRSFTIWPAYGAFREKETGSIEKGKFADFVILEKDIMKIDEDQIWSTNIFATYVNGENVYQRK